MYIVIIGCGKLGSRLAEEFSSQRHNIVVVDRNPRALNVLSDRFNGIALQGEGLSLEVLDKANLQQADAVYGVTGNDNLNLVAAQIAQKIFKVKKIVIQVYDDSKTVLVKNKGITVINRSNLFLGEFKKCIL